MDDRTAALLHGIISTAFIGTWIALAVVGLLASWRMGAAAKRRWMPRFTILTCVLFVCFVTTLMVLSSRSWSSLGILVVLVPVASLIVYLNIKLTKFCDKCGATQFNYNWFVPMKFCSKCGAALDTVEPLPDDRA